MDRSACPCETAISCAALRRNIQPGCCVFRKHFSKCSPPNSSGENGKAGVRSQVPGLRRNGERLRCPALVPLRVLIEPEFNGDKMKRCFLQVAMVLGCAMCAFAQ